VFEITGVGSIYDVGGTNVLATNSGGASTSSSIVVEPFEMFLEEYGVVDTLLKNVNTRYYDNAYFVDFITINKSGNKRVETAVIQVSNLSPKITVWDDGVMVTSLDTVIENGEAYENPTVVVYSMNNALMGEIKEIHTYKYIYMYEGREIDEINTSISGKYTIIVEASDEIGRRSRKVIGNLFVENPPVEPICDNNKTINVSSLISIISMLGLIVAVICKKKIYK